MNSGRPVRSIQGLYEASGNFAVPQHRAREVLEGSARVVGLYTGPIAVEPILGVNIPTPANPIDIRKVRLGSGLHTMLLTRRMILGTDGVRFGACHRVSRPGFDTTKTLVNYDPNYPAYASAFTVHEFGHGFGLEEHCNKAACIMQAALDKDTVAQALDAPFCDTCAEDLELAGYRALATQL